MTIDFRRRRPTPEALAWVERSIARRARVVGHRRLTGGLGSAVHRLTVELPSGERRFVVLRQYGNAKHASLVTRESSVLAALENTTVPAPRLLAADPDGRDAGGRPSLLMSRERGDVFLTPSDLDGWLEQMAAVLADIHELNIDAPKFKPWREVTDRPPPECAKNPALWDEVFDVLRQKKPRVPKGFIHGDFQHFNMLWARGRLTTVLDWTWPAIGPRGMDVGHCRLNLAVLISAEAADRFLDFYEKSSGQPLDPFWDLYGLAEFSDSWPRFIPMQVSGRRPVDTAGMAGRVEAVMAGILRRF